MLKKFLRHAIMYIFNFVSLMTALHHRENSNFRPEEKKNVEKQIIVDIENIDTQKILNIAEKLGATDRDLRELFIAVGFEPVEAQVIVGKLGTPIETENYQSQD